MRAALLLYIALVGAAPAVAQVPDWQLLPESPFAGYRFEDGAFVDAATGFLVDGEGRVHRTVDGGDTWTLRSSGHPYLRAAVFTSATTGWVGALFSSSRLFETTDAGATLVDATARISPPVGGGICGLWAVSADTVFGVGQYSGPAYVVRTTDGGATWQSTNLSALAGSLVDVHFIDAQRGLAVGGTTGATVGGQAVILATENGGDTWSLRYTGPPPPAGEGEWAWKISFPTDSVGYVSVERTFSSGGPGRVLKTLDGGQTWSVLSVPGASSMQGIGFLTSDRGWLSGRGSAMATTDGGATWAATTTIDTQVNRFAFLGDSLGFAMGQRVYALDARPVAAVPSPSGTPLVLGAPAPNPSSGSVRVPFELPRAGPAVLAVFDALGRRVAVLASGLHAAGAHIASWDGTAAAGLPAPPGVYLLRLRFEGEAATRALTLTR